jgi:GalNAc-alpha-(1->4)-GalNAc-alpha-(1->3)-diNAcBac-PP-undecaprenol alpha-1,4-N-acetyl-D-galactosaminyltransferase
MTKKHLRDPDSRTVLLVIGALQGGGAERQISDMANYWVAKDWKVILATWSGSEVADFYPLDARVSRVSLVIRTKGGTNQRGVRVNLARVARLRRLIAAERPDVVLSFMPESNILTIIAGVGLNPRVVVSERVQPALHTTLPVIWRTLRRILYRWADGVVAQTQDAAGWLEKNCRTAVTVIPNALRCLPEPSGERQKVVIAVGRLTHQKGFDVLLRAFARIAPNYRDWTLAIIGEGEERGSLTQLRSDLFLDERVEFVGQTTEIVAWMARAGLVVQPSRFEGFPNAVLESMGLGAAVISADCPSGPSEIIKEGVNGRLVPVDDVATLAEVMAGLMSRPEERKRLGRAAYGVRERYRQDVVMARWEACLFPQPAKIDRNTNGLCDSR